MLSLAGALLATPLLMVGYAYVLYPAVLSAMGVFRRRFGTSEVAAALPSISITVPAYNECGQIRETIEALLQIDYPAELRQILIVSDASSDGTDEIVSEYADRGVELLRLPERAGKTAGENAARPHLRGELIINTDASIRIAPDAIRPLVAQFADPRIGVASGRDVSMTHAYHTSNVGERGYVGYEMAVRALETKVRGIVGASGSLYAIRAELHRCPVPEQLSRDFSAALTAQRHGFRAVSVAESVCFVPRTPSLHREYTRKVRTITRGLGTLFHNADLLNPMRHGVFSWMLFSHKVCRWLVPWTLVIGLIGVVLLPFAHPAGVWVFAFSLLGAACAAAGWWWPEGTQPPRLCAVAAYVAVGNIAALHAWLRALGGQLNPTWEPTRRQAAAAAVANSQ